MSDTEGKKEEAQAPAAPAKKAMKKVTITALVDAETNQNDFKSWLKSCPFSIDGGQTIAWENVEVDAPADESAQAAEDQAAA